MFEEDTVIFLNSALNRSEIVAPKKTVCLFEAGDKICRDFKAISADVINSFIIENVSYTIYHEGIDGIKAVDVDIDLTNITDVASSVVQRRFSVDYKWFDAFPGKPATTLSGRPGYLRGKPLLLARAHLGVKAGLICYYSSVR